MKSNSPKHSSKKRRKKSRSRLEKRPRLLSSFPDFISNSSSSSSTESENEIVEKRFKIILKGEEFKWNLKSSMADYADLHF